MSICQPYEQVTVDLDALVKPPDDCSSSQRLTATSWETSSQNHPAEPLPKFLAHRDWEIININKGLLLFLAIKLYSDLLCKDKSYNKYSLSQWD